MPPTPERLHGVQIAIAHCYEVLGLSKKGQEHGKKYIETARDIGWDAVHWLSQRLQSVHVYLKCLPRKQVESMIPKSVKDLSNVHFKYVKNVGREDYAYFIHLKSGLWKNSDWTIFIQAGDLWLPTIACLRNKFPKVVIQKGFASILPNYAHGTIGQKGTGQVASLIEKVYKAHLPFMRKFKKLEGLNVKMYAQAGFIVSKDTLRRIPEKMYGPIVDLLHGQDQAVKSGSMTGREIGLVLEYTYHLILSGVHMNGSKPELAVKPYQLELVCGLFDCSRRYCYFQLSKFKVLQELQNANASKT